MMIRAIDLMGLSLRWKYLNPSIGRLHIDGYESSEQMTTAYTKKKKKKVKYFDV